MQQTRPGRLSRQTTKQPREIDRNTALQRAQITGEEANAAYRAEKRNENGNVLAGQAVERAVLLNHHITQRTKGNPGLEMALRANIEEPVMMSAGYIVSRYMNRP
jgi:hypothetical protein